MVPMEFPDMNTTMRAPGCADLPVCKAGNWLVSCWELTDDERKAIADGGKIWLLVAGQAHPPVSLTTDFPFVKNEEWPDDLKEPVEDDV